MRDQKILLNSRWFLTVALRILSADLNLQCLKTYYPTKNTAISIVVLKVFKKNLTSLTSDQKAEVV